MTAQLALFECPEALPPKHRWRRGQLTCPICGTEEPADYLVHARHGIRWDGTIASYPIGKHPTYGAMCVAQWMERDRVVAEAGAR